MGIKEVKQAFQEEIAPGYNCTMALLDNVRVGKVESQVLLFRVIDPNGAEFDIKSDPIPGGVSLVQAAKDTALQLLNKKTE